MDKAVGEWCEENLVVFSVDTTAGEGEDGFIASSLVDIFERIREEKLYTVVREAGTLCVMITLVKPRRE